MAQDRAEIIATKIHPSTSHEGRPLAATSALIRAKGRAKTECSTLIIRKVRPSLFKKESIIALRLIFTPSLSDMMRQLKLIQCTGYHKIHQFTDFGRPVIKPGGGGQDDPTCMCNARTVIQVYGRQRRLAQNQHEPLAFLQRNLRRPVH